MPRKPKPLSVPGVPTGLTATPGNMLINLAWNAPASNGGSAITAYRLYRNDQLWHQTAGARFYLDNTSLVAGSQYRYRVSAVNALGEGLKSAEASVTAINTNPPPVYTVPAAPASLTATGGNGLVNLTWTPPVSNGGTAITNYRVYRNGSSLIVLGNVLTYQNTGLSNGIPYSYQGAAINAVGEGPQSVSKTATPGDVTPPIVGGIAHSNVTQTTATVSWSINEPATGQVEYGLTAAYGLTTTFEPGYLPAHAQPLTLLTPNTVYHYRAKSLDAAGNPGYSSDRTFQTTAVQSSLHPTPSTLVYVAPPVPPAIPAYLLKTGVAQTQWGTRMTRVSNTSGIRNTYATSPGWNSDGTKILLGSTTGPPVFINGTTYAEIRRPPFLVGNAHWAFTDPTLLYGAWNGDMNLYSQNVVTDALVSLYNFSAYTNISMGSAEGHMSMDDRYFPLLTVAGSQQGILVYDRTTDAIISQRNLGVRPDLCQMSPLGNYVVINWNIDAVGSEKGVWLYDRALNPIRQLTATGGNHGDVGLDVNGNEVYVYIDGAITSHRLSVTSSTQVLPSPTAFSAGHVSCRNFNRRGYVYCSMYDYPNSGTRIGKDQVVAAPLAPNGTVEVFGWSYHRNDGSTASNYATNPFAVPSPDGTKVLFGSEFGGASTYAYVLEV